MRFPISDFQFQVFRRRAAFTMMEVAISLAIIGFALVAIIGVLPYGMNTQRDNREETVINQDATMLMEAIRNGAYQHDELTNYIYAISNVWTRFDINGQVIGAGTNGYAFNTVPNITSAIYPQAPFSGARLLSGTNIIALLSMPEFVADTWPISSNYPAVPGRFYAAKLYNAGCYSNRVVAYVRAISGLAAEKPPQDNAIMREDAFTYRLLVLNSPVPQDTNANFQGFTRQLAANQNELRLTFTWPVQPNGSIGSGHQTYRATVAGQLVINTNAHYFYQPQNFVFSAP